MEINLTEIIVAVLGLLGIIVTSVIVPFLKTKLTAEKQKDLANIVKIVVYAIEQLANSGVILKEDKKKAVIKKLAEMGIDVTDERIYRQVDMLIEAFVSEMNGNLYIPP